MTDLPQRRAYYFSLAVKDLVFNRNSSLLLIIIICFVCLPLLLLGTLKERYIQFLRNDIEMNTQAKRIEVVIPNAGSSDVRMDNKWIEMVKQRSDVETVIPHRVRTIFIQNQDSDLIDFDAVSTQPHDPDLRRYGFQGEFPNHKRAIILHERHIRDLGISGKKKTISLIVSRTNEFEEEQFVIECELIGLVNSGDQRVVYIPLQLAEDLEQWRKGYAVPDLNLPGNESREKALEEPHFLTGLLTTTEPLKRQAIPLLNSYGLNHQAIGVVESDPTHLYEIHTNDNKGFSESNWLNVSDSLAALTPSILVPQVNDIVVSVNGNAFGLVGTYSNDFRAKSLLVKGRWLGSDDDLFTLIIPHGVLGKSPEFPSIIEIKIAGQPVKMAIIGEAGEGKGYARPELLFRLNQLQQGEIKLSMNGKGFEPSTIETSYIVSRVYANNLDNIESICDWMVSQGLLCVSAQDAIDQMKKVNKLINNLLILIGVTGIIAVICALSGILYESVYRKRRQIGIMRALGVARHNIALTYIYQAGILGGLGYLTVTVLQYGIAGILDTEFGHNMLGIEIGERLFTTSIGLRVQFGAAIVAICLLTGTIPAYIASKVDPGIVLSE